MRIEDGERIMWADAIKLVFLASDPELTVAWGHFGPGQRGAKPHVHREHTDSFYVLEGEITFALGPDRRVPVPAGGFVSVPPGVAHGFDNDSDADARCLNFHTPGGGFADYMRGIREGRPVACDMFDPSEEGDRPAAEAIVSMPGEGERLEKGNRVAVIKGELEHISLSEFTIEGPFPGPDPHLHDDHIDSFYVLEGTLDVTLDGATSPIGPGELAWAPRGAQHTFGHSGDGVVRFLNMHVPDAGFAQRLRGM